ncbi:MAG: alpha/beta fold hydrolase [Nitriliruptor sp.]|uniref:alpha/beta fold hydrolase n=1 Tax=Nitriliruptor sp. TaxID=2448056 RepID=UPI0034A02808
MPRPADARLRWHRTTLDGRTVVYGEAGDGPPVVFVHGWGLSARSYADALPLIAASGHRVIAPALPGFGRSDPLPGEYTFEKLANWLDTLLDHLGVDEPAALVGHSFGGGVSTATAWYHPGRARSLTLVNSIGGSVWKDSTKGPRSLADRPLWDWGLHLPAEFRPAGLGGRLPWRQSRTLPVVVRDVLTNALTNPRAVWRAADLARRADLRDELAELAERGLPVSIVWGAEDTVVPEATFLAMCDAAGAQGDIIEDAGHSWLLLDPVGFGEVVTNSIAVRDTVADRTPRPVDTRTSTLDRPA